MSLPHSMLFQWSFDSLILESRLGHMLAVASLTFFLYDILLTFDQEVALIHNRARWGFSKILYLLNRYLVLTIMVINTLVLLLPDPSVQFCNFASRYSGLGGIIAKYVLDVWLLLRVYAIWGRDQKVMLVLGGFFLANVCVTCVIGGISFHNSHAVAIPGPRLPNNLATGCIITPPIPNFWIIFVSSLVFEVAVFTFTLWRAIQHIRSANFRPRDTPLFTHLYRTGVMYFAVMALTMAFMSCTALVAPLQHIVLPSQFLCAFVSTVCARMMLSIRAVIKGIDHFSAVHPEDMHIAGFWLTPLSLVEGLGTGQGLQTSVRGQGQGQPVLQEQDETQVGPQAHSNRRHGADMGAGMAEGSRMHVDRDPWRNSDAGMDVEAQEMALWVYRDRESDP